MLNKEQFRTTPLRFIFIVGAATLVAFVVFWVAFPTPESQPSLLPPWQLFVAEACCISILLFVGLRNSRRRKGQSVFLTAIVVSIVLTGLFALFWGVGHTWSMMSAVGKTLAAFLTLAYPILLTTLAVLVMRKNSVETKTIAAVSFGLCALLTAPMILVGLTLACALTGDCI